MPYDLVVHGHGKVPLEDVLDYARAAPWIEIDGDSDGALVTNVDTGVYVTLAPESGAVLFAVHFQRPHFFAREALMLAATFISEYRWRIYDPQRECEVHGTAADVEAGVAAWERLNALQDGRIEQVPIDSGVASEAWRWNYERSHLERTLQARGDAAYVPRLFYVKAEGIRRARTAVFFPHDATKIVLPSADYLVYRDERGHAHIIDRPQFIESAAYYTRPSPDAAGATVVDAPRFSLLRSSLERSKRGPFRAGILASDMLTET